MFLTLIVPTIFYPFAIIWLSLSHFLGLFVPKILLSIIFYLIVTPVGVIRRIFGLDTLSLKKYKKDARSVMVERNYTYLRSDIEKPF